MHITMIDLRKLLGLFPECALPKTTESVEGDVINFRAEKTSEFGCIMRYLLY